MGEIPLEYAKTLIYLSQHFRLAAVIDIWVPKDYWLQEFGRVGVKSSFSALSFSSDHGIVKPSPKPYNNVLKEFDIEASEALVIGDSISRDMGGANSSTGLMLLLYPILN